MLSVAVCNLTKTTIYRLVCFVI